MSRLSQRAQLENAMAAAIVAAGFNQVPVSKRARSCEWAFEDPRTGKTYSTYSNGYVRVSWIGTGYYTQGHKQATQLTRELVDNPIERLAFILRRAQSTKFNP